MITWLLGLAGALLALPRPRFASIRLGRTVVARRHALDRAPAGPGRALRVGIAVLAAATDRARPVALSGAASVAGLLWTSGLRPGAAAAAGLLCGVLLHAGLTGLSRRADRRDRDAVGLALTVLEAELVAGAREDAALAAAAAVAGRSGPSLREAAGRAGTGDGIDSALARSELLRPLAAAWRVRHECGAPLADAVGQVARDVELRRTRDLAVAAALAGPRSSSALLATLPIVGIGLGTVMGARPLPFLFGSTNGSIALLAGVALDVAGWAWTGAMVRRARS